MTLAEPNTPWVSRILSRHWDRIQAEVGPGLMPRRSPIPGPRFHEYGCGGYGCVLPTNIPGVVLKVTSDPTEVAFVNGWLSQRKPWPEGCVAYYRTLSIPSTHHRRPVQLLWRQEAEKIGDLRQDVNDRNSPRYEGANWLVAAQNFAWHGKDVMSKTRRRDWDSVIFQSNRAADWAHGEIEERLESGRIPRRYWMSDWLNQGSAASRAFGDWTASQRLALSIAGYAWCVVAMQQCEPVYMIGIAMDVFLGGGYMLADVHLQNVGTIKPRDRDLRWPHRAITDPGHAVPVNADSVRRLQG